MSFIKRISTALGAAFESESVKQARALRNSCVILHDFSGAETPTRADLAAFLVDRRSHFQQERDAANAAAGTDAAAHARRLHAAVMLHIFHTATKTSDDWTDATLGEAARTFLRKYLRAWTVNDASLAALHALPADPVLDTLAPDLRSGALLREIAAYEQGKAAAVKNPGKVVLKTNSPMLDSLNRDLTFDSPDQAYRYAMTCWQNGLMAMAELKGFARYEGELIELFSVRYDGVGSQTQKFSAGWEPLQKIKEYKRYEEWSKPDDD